MRLLVFVYLCAVASTSALSPLILIPARAGLWRFLPSFSRQALSTNPGPSASDLRKQYEELMDSGPVTLGQAAMVVDHMSTSVTTLDPETSLHDASCMLTEQGITGAPVVEVRDGGRKAVIGMLSQTDLLYKAAGRSSIPISKSGPASLRYTSNTVKMRKALAGTCRGAMTTDVIHISEGSTMQEAATLLLKHHVSRLPVLDVQGGCVGIITTTDVMQLIVTDPEGCALRA
jgi:CBS domain-containing protein